MSKRRFARKNTKQTKKLKTVRKRRRKIGNKRLERALLILAEDLNLAQAARSIRVSPGRFRRAAAAKGLIKKRGKRWIIAGGLPRQMVIYSEGQRKKIIVPGVRSAGQVGKYMSAVGRFLRSNKIAHLKQFSGFVVKDIHGKSHAFETNPNILYRLDSAGGDVFESIYRIVV